MRKFLITACALAVLAVALPLQAQQVVEITEEDVDNFVGLLRANILDERADLVGQAMEFSADESAAFWPMYSEYDRAMTALGQRRWELIKDFAASYETMDDATAAALLQTSFEIRSERMQQQFAFVERLAATMGAKIAARFTQVDNQLTSLLDLQIAQQLPLVQKPQ
ncbi:MAG: hypothetical protein GKS06_19315 [Acidobacteria bacterium]|nr:hypothetical protein [Acidobacteriota bacterium]